MQASTPITIRSALTGTAYESARKIHHTELTVPFDKDAQGPVDTKGMLRLLDKLAEDLIQAKPMRAAELFDKLFFAKTVWRSPGESMQAYIVRREKEFADLNLVSHETAISDDIKAHLLLRFANIPAKAHAGIIASSDNE